MPDDPAPKILVVDDDEGARAAVCRTLRFHDYEVLEAAGPEEAVEKARELDGSLDLLVTDVVLGDTTGSRLAHRILEVHPGLGVLFVSGYVDDEVSRSVPDGVETDFLEKPMTIDELSSRVRTLLDRVQASGG